MVAAGNRDIALFSFIHEHRGVSANITVSKQILGADDGGQGVMLRPLNESGVSLGFLKGRWLSNLSGVIFEAKTSISSQTYISEGKFPIPRVVGATIAQLVLRGQVRLWHSAARLSTPGRRMYEGYLANHPGIVVSKENGVFRVEKQTCTYSEGAMP